MADTAFAKHQCTALAAVQLGGEQIAFLCLMTGRGFFVFGDFLLHILKQFQRNNGRDGIRHDLLGKVGGVVFGVAFQH